VRTDGFEAQVPIEESSHLPPMKSALPLSLLTLLAPLAFAQESTGPARAWDRFVAEQAPAVFHAAWNPATGTPHAIYGDGLRVAPRVEGIAHARELAEGLLLRRADLLGQGASTFVESIGQRAGRLYVFVYDQRFRGLEVIGGRADVRLNENGVVAMFGSKAVPIPEGFPVAPSIPMEMAWAIAHDHLKVAPRGAEALRPAAELVVHAAVEGTAPTLPRLAWRVGVDVRDGEDLTVGQVFVDARTGAAFEFVDQVYRCGFGHTHVKGETLDAAAHAAPRAAGHLGRNLARARAAAPVDITGNVRAWMNKGNPLTARTNEPVQGIRVSAAGIGSAITDVNGDFTIPYAGSNPVTLTVTLGSGGGEYLGGGISPQQGSLVATSVQATPGVPAQIQLLGPNPAEFDWSQTTTFWHVDDVYRWVDGLTGSIPTNRINMANMRATVNRASTCNAFYTNNSINFYATGGSCNMTAFDSVIYHEWGHGVDDAFGGISQTDGLSEGWGDIMSIYRLGDPIVGRNFTTSGGIVRDARNTFTYPAGGAVHQQGQTWMGFAWDLRNRLITSLGAQAGAARAEAIVIPTLAANATNQPDAVREVFLMDDDDGNLNNGTPNCADILAAAQGRRLPTPITRCQGMGDWSAYGSGCSGSGTGPANCASLNGNGGPLRTGTFLNEYAFGHQAATAGTLIGFELYTRSTTGSPEVVEVRVYRESSPGSGTPSQTPAGTGSITADTTLAFYTATLNAPVGFAAGERLWIAQRESTRIVHSALSSGQTQTLATYYRRTTGGTTWLQSAVTIPAWRWVCQGGGQPGAIPVMSASGEPLIGRSFPVQVSWAAPNALALLVIGASDQTWGGLGLPYDLGVLGGVGCQLLSSIEITEPATISAQGQGLWSIPVPGDVGLVGQTLYSQAVMLDAAANTLGMSFTNGGALLIGRP
jgi:hypothetical protein